jgi:hypothetical protein
MFSEMTGENEAAVMASLAPFAKFKPEAFKGIEKDTQAQCKVVHRYIRERDLGAVAN